MEPKLKQRLSGIMIIASLLSSPLNALADIMDLPNPEDELSDNVGDIALPGQLSLEFKSSTEVSQISRKSGGSWYYLTFDQETNIADVSLSVLANKVKIYQVVAVLADGTKQNISALVGENVLSQGTTISGKALTLQKVTRLELLAESFGAVATVGIELISPQSSIRLVVENSADAAPPKVERPKEDDKDRLANFDIPLRAGDDAILLGDSAHYKVQIVGMGADKKYTVRYLDAPWTGTIQAGWSRKYLAMSWGCSHSYCVGDEVLNKDRDHTLVKVIGLLVDGTHVLEFLEGDLKGRQGAKWTGEALSSTKKCGATACVGEEFGLIKEREFHGKVKVKGTLNGKYIIEFLEGPHKSKRSGYWPDASIVAMKGCLDGFCVGDTAYSKGNDFATVRILGITADKQFVLQFLDGTYKGWVGGRWPSDKLSKSNK